MATTLEQINVGAAPNDDTGDKIREGGIKINNNTTKIGNLLNKIDEGKVQVFKDVGGPGDVANIAQDDVIRGIIEVAAVKYFIFAKYSGVGLVTDYGTVANDFNDGSSSSGKAPTSKALFRYTLS